MKPVVKLLINQPENLSTDLTVVLAHGAGAAMDSVFMVAMAEGLCSLGVKTIRFEFPYMAERRVSGKKRPPDKMPVLESCFAELLEQFGPRCVAAGKSMGGRVASLMLAQARCVAAMSLGYPFHPPGKPDNLRSDHWPMISRPWLIVQGTRDPFGTRAEVAHYPLPASARLHWLEDGEHDFKPRKASGFTQPEHWQMAIQQMYEFIRTL